MKTIIQDALDKLENVQSKELDCAMLANLVGYRIQRLAPEAQVEVVEGEAEELPIHYWLRVNGERVDPWATYYKQTPSWYLVEEEDEVYSVFGPEYSSGAYEKSIWKSYLAT